MLSAAVGVEEPKTKGLGSERGLSEDGVSLGKEKEHGQGPKVRKLRRGGSVMCEGERVFKN